MSSPTELLHQASAASGCGSTLVLLKRLLEQPFDADLWSSVADPHLHVRIGSAKACTHRVHSLELLRRFVEEVELPRSQFCEVWKRRETIFAETELLLRRHPDRTIPCVIVLRTGLRRIMDIRIYGDLRLDR